MVHVKHSDLSDCVLALQEGAIRSSLLMHAVCLIFNKKNLAQEGCSEAPNHSSIRFGILLNHCEGSEPIDDSIVLACLDEYGPTQ